MSGITTGVWRIFNTDPQNNNRYLRDYDGAILVGLGKPDNHDKRSMWRLDYMDAERINFTITNSESGRHAFADPPNETSVVSGREIKWEITKAGESEHHIRFPSENFYWTVPFVPVPGVAPVILVGLEGEPGQHWKFEWVGDF